MHKLKLVIAIIFVVSSLSGCASHRVKIIEKRAPVAYKACEVEIYDINEEVPRDSKLIGKGAFGDSGLSVGCGLSDRQIQMKKEACNLGANIIKINKEANPSFMTSTCYRAKVSYFYSSSKSLGNESISKQGNGKVKKLQEINQLLNDGAINQEEFNALKKEIINDNQ